MKMRNELILLVWLLVFLSGCSSDGTDEVKSLDYTSAYIGSLLYVPAGAYERDNPTNISEVSSFRISQFEIKRSEFLAVMGLDPSDTNYSSGLSDPVQNVTWYEAIVFCNKLSILENLYPVYSVSVSNVPINWYTFDVANIPNSNNSDWNSVECDWEGSGYRLPTEMEWRWAAMGAPEDGMHGGINNTGYSRSFAGSNGSNSIGEYAVFGYYSEEPGRTLTEKTSMVGSKRANELNLFDMTGNVWEYCWDWYPNDNSLPSGSLVDYTGVDNGLYRIRLGGCWDNTEVQCALATRNANNPDRRSFTIGIRLVRR